MEKSRLFWSHSYGSSPPFFAPGSLMCRHSGPSWTALSSAPHISHKEFLMHSSVFALVSWVTFWSSGAVYLLACMKNTKLCSDLMQVKSLFANEYTSQISTKRIKSPLVLGFLPSKKQWEVSDLSPLTINFLGTLFTSKKLLWNTHKTSHIIYQLPKGCYPN